MVTRRERVVLELEDRFSQGIAEAAVKTATFERTLNNLDGTSRRTEQSLGDLDQPTKRVGRSAGDTDRSINQLTGRLHLLRDVALTLGPALVPLGGSTVVAVAGLAQGLGAAAGAAGVAVMALNGVGEALESVRTYELEPTTENLQAMREQMRTLDDSGRDFVRLLHALGPELRELQATAAGGALPGFGEGLTELVALAPQVEVIVGEIASALGDMAEASGEALAGDRFTGFFDYIETTAGPTIRDFAISTGLVVETLANLLAAMSPASADFTGGLVEKTRELAEWSRRLGEDQGFQDFLAYIRETAPDAVALLGSLIRAVAGVVEAAAPLGATLLPVLTAISDAFAAIASSPIGTPLLTVAAALATLNRAASVGAGLMTRMSTGLDDLGVSAGRSAGGLDRVTRNTGRVLALATAVGLLGDAVAEASGAKVDTANLARDIEAVTNGTSRDLVDRAVSDLESTRNWFNRHSEWAWEGITLGGLITDTPMDTNQANLEAIDQQLAALVESGNAEQAAAFFDSLLASLSGLPEGSNFTRAFVDETMADFGAYSTALGNAEAATEEATDVIPEWASATREAAQAARAERIALDEATDAMLEKTSATLSGFDAETRWRQALEDARDVAADSTAGIKGSSEAALANRSSLSQLAAAWNNQSAAVRNNKDRFREAKAAFIETAEAMGVPEQKARDLAAELLAIPKSRVAKVEARTEQAEGALAAAKVRLDALQDKTVWLTVRTVNRGGMGPQEVAGVPAAAAGSIVPNPLARPPFDL